MTDLLTNAGAHLDALAFRALAATGARALAVAVHGPAGPLRERVYGFPDVGTPASALMAGARARLADGDLAVAACASPDVDLAAFAAEVRRHYAAALAGGPLPELPPAGPT